VEAQFRLLPDLPFNFLTHDSSSRHAVVPVFFNATKFNFAEAVTHTGMRAGLRE
jgi:hypothetical protein